VGYTAVKGGADAIAAAEKLIQTLPRDPGEPGLEIRQLRHQLGAAVDKVVGEGGVYAPDLAAQAILQTEGDLFEAAFTLRAYRSTLPRLGYAEAVRGTQMRLRRRISSAFRDIPGGQLLGRTRDYTQRLLEVLPARTQRANGHATNGRTSIPADDTAQQHAPKVADVLRAMGLMAPPAPVQPDDPPDLTRESMRFPVTRPAWLQAPARGESGALVCLAYSSLRGYGGRADHGTVAELRVGDLPLRVTHPLSGQPMTVGWFRATEVEMVGGASDAKSASKPGNRHQPKYGLSYGLVFGQHERKAIAMALLDSSLQAAVPEQGEPAPANDQEMVLSHIDGIESFGFVEHLKLPHFVTFGSSLRMSAELESDQPSTETTTSGLHHHGDGVLHSHD
jgi:alpha-D-ribose 1-methylphosphonate 5-triphosphate synthase subunit PhnI